MMIKFSSSSSLLTFDFCTKSVAHKREEFLTKVNHKHSKKTDTKFSLSSLSLSLCFHDNRRTTLLTRFETNFSILVALYIRVVINAAVLFLSSSHFENERVGERERVQREERGNNNTITSNDREKSERTPTRCEVGSRHRRLVETNRLRRDWWDHVGDVDVSRDDGEDGSGGVWNRYRRWERVRRCQQTF